MLLVEPKISIQRISSSPEEAFIRLFQTGNIQSTYDTEIAGTGIMGIDRLGASTFDAQKHFHFDVIQRKCSTGTYRFSPYVEVLKSKGRTSFPRVISIPTVRDRIVLYLLKELLHEVFSDCVNRSLPNARIEEINNFIQANDISKLSFIKLDIKAFYDSINHSVLIKKLQERIDSKIIIRLIRTAIESPTVPTGYRKSQTGRRCNNQGVPQGLAISNILADIYLHEFDNKVRKDVLLYHRYVDDVFSIINTDCAESEKENIISELGLLHLKLNEEKCKTTFGDKEFEYLGYQFFLPKISVRQSTIDRFINSIAARFTAYRKGTSAFHREHPKVSPEVRREVFVEDLNEKITGALSEKRRYGWVFFFLQINDVELLHKLDFIIRSFFSRLDDFKNSPPNTLKSLAKSYYEAHFSVRSGYIHDYSKYTTVQEKINFLARRGVLDPDTPYKQVDVDRMFETVKRQHLTNLEIDVGTIS